MVWGGLVGLALAQLVQGALVAAACWVVLRQVLPAAPIAPWRWDRSLFREMLAYGLQYQALSAVRLFYEPVTKALVSRFGGLDAAGYYEMATLILTKLRSLIVAAQQALTPEVAMLEETAPETVDAVYARANGLNWYISIPLFAVVIASAPLISMAWIGRYEDVFVVFTVLLGIGWFFNALSGPAYFVLLGTGQMGGVVASHLTIGIVNAVGGFALGWVFGGTGVAWAWTLALGVGAVHLLLRLQKDRGVPLDVPSSMPALAWTALVALTIVGAVFQTRSPSAAGAVFGAVLVAASVAAAAWRLPYRHELLVVLRRGVSKERPSA